MPSRLSFYFPDFSCPSSFGPLTCPLAGGQVKCLLGGGRAVPSPNSLGLCPIRWLVVNLCACWGRGRLPGSPIPLLTGSLSCPLAGGQIRCLLRRESGSPIPLLGLCPALLLAVKLTELGTRQFCRDNVTMLSGHKVVCTCYFTIFIVATPSRH